MIYNSNVVTIEGINVSSNFPNSSLITNLTDGLARISITNTDGLNAEVEKSIIEIVFRGIGENGSYSDLNLKNVELSNAGFNPYAPNIIINSTIIIGVYGDFNGNGWLDIGDAAKVAYMVVGKVPVDMGADFNKNQRVDIGDAAKIAYFLVGKVNSL